METVQERKPLILQAIEFADLLAFDFPELVEGVDYPAGLPESEVTRLKAEHFAAVEDAWEREIEARFGDIKERFTVLRKVEERETFLSEQHDPEINALKRELDLRIAGKKRHEAHANRVHRLMEKTLRIVGTPVEAEGFVFKLQKNGGRPKVEIFDRESVPEEYRVPQPWQPDTIMIGIDVEKNGKEVPGVKVERGTHMRIKAA
jgi:hypothetical protein